MAAAPQDDTAQLCKVAKDNYLSREFLEQEKKHLWPKI